MERKNHLDEMQEQKLLKIESRGYWIAFWGLGLSLLIQQIMYGPGEGARYMAGEWIVFMVIALYLSFACMKAGIWDRRLQPTLKDNVFMSICAGLIGGVVMFLTTYLKYHKLIGSIASGVFIFFLIGGLCIVILSASAASYKKKIDEMEKAMDEEESLD